MTNIPVFATRQRQPVLSQQQHNTQWIIPWYGSLGMALLCIALLSVGLHPPVLQAQTCIAKNILFVASSTILEGRDDPLRLYLLALGHKVTVRSGTAVQTADAIGKDLIIISESVESMDVHTKFRDVAVPLITWEGWLQDDLGMTGPEQYVDYGENLRQQDIYIINGSHPLAAGLSGVVATTQSKRNKFHWGIPNANAAIVAVDIDSDKHAMLYAYEVGAQMVGLSAPARRIFLHNATGSNLTLAGWRLFDAAVAWGLGCSNAQPTATPLLTATATHTSTSTATNTPTSTPTPTATATATPSATSSGTVTPPFTATPSPSPTRTTTATPSVTPSATATAVASVQLAFQKQDLLFIDADENGLVSPGDTLLYVIDIRNTGLMVVTGLALEDLPDANTTLIAGTVRTDRGTVRIGNATNDRHVVVDIGDLATQEAVRILLQVQVQAADSVTHLHNQAQVRYVLTNPSGQGQQLSDDPDTTENNDRTTTPLGQPTAPLARQLYLPVIAK